MRKYAWLIILMGIVILVQAGIDNPSPNSETLDGLTADQFLRSDELDWTTKYLGAGITPLSALHVYDPTALTAAFNVQDSDDGFLCLAVTGVDDQSMFYSGYYSNAVLYAADTTALQLNKASDTFSKIRYTGQTAGVALSGGSTYWTEDLTTGNVGIGGSHTPNVALEVDGAVKAYTPVTSYTVASTNLTSSDVRGTVAFNGDDDVITFVLPPITEVGETISIGTIPLYARVITVDVTNVNDSIILNDGTYLAERASVDSPGAVTDKATFLAITTTNWLMWNVQGTWVATP